jgi:hypothetical protein
MTRKILAIVTAVMFGIAMTSSVARGGGGLGDAHVARNSEYYHDKDCHIPNYLRITTNLCAYETHGLFDERSAH